MVFLSYWCIPIVEGFALTTGQSQKGSHYLFRSRVFARRAVLRRQGFSAACGAGMLPSEARVPALTRSFRRGGPTRRQVEKTTVVKPWESINYWPLSRAGSGVYK